MKRQGPTEGIVGSDAAFDAWCDQQSYASHQLYYRKLLAANRRLRAEVRRLKRQVEGHCERIAAQSELLSKRAEAQP